jgi:hypothetical protein
MTRVEPVIESLHSHIRTADPGGLLGVYLFGSVVVGGLVLVTSFHGPTRLFVTSSTASGCGASSSTVAYPSGTSTRTWPP